MVREDMKFIGYCAFYKNRYRIKSKYKTLTLDEKIVYKYYVYSRRHLQEHTCDIIWLFLNDSGFDDTSKITLDIMKNECRKYRNECR